MNSSSSTARALIRAVSLLAPAHLRTRWREEWLAECDAIARRRGHRAALGFALGAPADAWSSRWTTRTAKTASRWHGPWRSDLRQTMRAVARSPWHVATVSVCLGVGIAVCTTTFSIVNALIGGDLPGIADRDRLARLYVTTDEWHGRVPGYAARADYEILSEGTAGFEAIAAEGRASFAVRLHGQAAMSADGAFVSGGYFGVLGTQAAFGRLLEPSDDRAGAPVAVVLSHAFWQGRLGAPAGIVGRAIVVGGREAIVAGVAPLHFSGLDAGAIGDAPGARVAIYVPLAHARGWPGAPAEAERWLTVVGRTKETLAPAALGAELQPLASRIEQMRPETRKNAEILAAPINSCPPARVSRAACLVPGSSNAELIALVMMLMAAPLMVLLIGCANVANLQLVRASLRTRELAVRASLGASRGQIVRLLTMEAALLAAIASGAGALGTALLLRVTALLVPVPVRLDTTVFGFSVAVAALVVTATGLIPALMATRRSAADGLRSGGRSMSAGNSRTRRLLVITQVALCFMLLLTAALFTRGLFVLAGDVPAEAREMLVAGIRFDGERHPGAARRAALDTLAARLTADGRVRAIGFSDAPPLSHIDTRFWLPGDPPGMWRTSGASRVSGGYFAASGIRLLRGRAFTGRDERDGLAAIVDEAFIARHGLREPVLGQRLRLAAGEGEGAHDGGRDAIITGVASNDPMQPAGIAPRGAIYLPFTPDSSYVSVLVRADAARALAEPVRAAIAAIDPDLPPLGVRTVADQYALDAEGPRLIAKAAAMLGAMSLLLALSGLYSVIAFFVAIRRVEFGIRMAIGARPHDIVNLVVGQAIRLVGAGLAAGALLGAPVLLGLAAAFPFTQPFDPAVVVPTALGLAITAIVAGWLPARKAAAIEPTVALRAE